MQPILKRIMLAVVIYSIVIYLLGWFAFKFFLAAYYLPVFSMLPILFIGFAAFGGFMFDNGLKVSVPKATSTFLVTRMVKIVFSLIVGFAYCLFNKADAIHFLIGFAVLYLLYLIFETWFYFTLASKNQKNE